MKPKGVRKVVPSVLLWKNAERNERSTTFSKKLIKNILMFIEIMALLFLMLAAMSPAIKRNVSGSSKSTILVIDATGSMQFEDEGSGSRFEEAIRDAKDFVETSSGEVSIITCGESVEVLANKSRDKQKMKRLLSGIEPTDASGDIRDAEGIMESLECEDIIVFTDGYAVGTYYNAGFAGDGVLDVTETWRATKQPQEVYIHSAKEQQQ